MRRRWSSVCGLAIRLILVGVIAAPSLGAHDGKPHSYHDLWRTWGWDPWVVISLAVSAWLYVRGVRRMWRTSARSRERRGWEATAFGVGWLSLFVALVSPLHPLGEVLFSAHMVQHEILMLVAAPLLVLSRPLVPFLWALPMSWRRSLGKAGKAQWVRKSWGALIDPLIAWLVHGVAVWVWHAPALFQATLTSDFIHTLQHLSFLVSALLFWWALIHGRNGLMGYGAAVLYVFSTAMHSGLLGALLTFATTLWYPAYEDTTASWGLTPLEDQQLGGLIMWVPAGMLYVLAGLALFAAWVCESERRALRQDSLLNSNVSS